MNSFEIQCITEGLPIDTADLSTKSQSELDKTNYLISENWHDSSWSKYWSILLLSSSCS